MRSTLVMPPGSLRFWTIVLAACTAAGCARHADPRVDLAMRAEDAANRLKAMGPHLSRVGLTADGAITTLSELRQDISAMPEPAPPAPAKASLNEPLAVVAADGNRWRVGLGAELMAVRLRIRGNGSEITDVGPMMPGAFVSMNRLLPFDNRGGLRLGGEVATDWQFRQGGQYLGIISLRPVIELAVADICIRPIIEIGQPMVNLGTDPGAITKADASWAFGGRLGVRLGDADIAVGWKRFAFIAHGEGTEYRIDGEGPEASLRWSF